MIGYLLLSLSLGAPGIDVAKAEGLYEQARYEAALGALGVSCAEATKPTHCEQVRAFVLMALGREIEARAAFERMLLADPESQLPPDVSPKMLALFDAAHKAIDAASNVKLKKVDVPKDGGAWELDAIVGSGVTLASLTAYIAPAGRDLFKSVELMAKGTSWRAQFESGFAAEAGAHYYLVAVLDDGTQVFVGSKDKPLRLELTLGGKPVGAGPPSALDSDDAEDAASADAGVGGGAGFFERMPRWGWYAIIGGGAAVVASAVLIGVLASGDDGPGRLKVNITVQE